MKEYITRCIKYKRNDKYNYEYLDMKGNHINQSIVKRLLEFIYTTRL